MTSKSTTTCSEPSMPLPVPWKPHKYQITAVRFLLEHACAALLLSPGLGKSSISLAALTFLKRRGMLSKTLVIAPLRPCYSVWPREIQKWTDFYDLKVEVLHGPHKVEALAREADIYVINPEGLDWLLGAVYTKRGNKTSVSVDVKRFASLGFDVLIVDELSKFKAHDTNRFKALKLVLHTFGRRWGLTGSPASNGLMGLFGQAYILDMGNALGQYITHYRNSYFIPDRSGFVWTLAPGAEERIYEKLEPLVLRMSDDVIDMPELVENDIYVDLPTAAMVMYRELERHLITALEEGLVTAATAASASMKCRQIANGGIYLDRPIEANGLKKVRAEREWKNIHTAKIGTLRDLVDELQGQPLLVAYDFEHDVDRLRKEFPTATFACDISARKFDVVERAWNAGTIDVLFGHPASIGHGLNLQGAGNHVAWHSLTWDYDLYDQFIRRVFRQGNKHGRVFAHRIIARGTIDEVIINALRGKEVGQQALFKGILEMAKLRRSK